MPPRPRSGPDRRRTVHGQSPAFFALLKNLAQADAARHGGRDDDDDDQNAAPGTHTLKVNKGRGSGHYKAGELVTVTADEPPAGETFESWIGKNPDNSNSDHQAVANPWLETTTVTMPNMDVQITPTHVPK